MRCALLFLGALVCVAAKEQRLESVPASKGVDVSVTAAQWPSGVLSRGLEAAEYLSRESRGLFWEYASSLDFGQWEKDAGSENGATEGSSAGGGDAIAAAGPDSTVDSLISRFVPDVTLQRMMKLSLELRVFAPAIESDRRMAAAARTAVLSLSDGTGAFCREGTFPHAAFALVEGVGAVCSSERLAEAMAAAKVVPTENTSALDYTVHGFDHVYDCGSVGVGDGARMPTPTVIVYGTLGTRSFRAFHRAVSTSSACTSGNVRYVFRHGYLSSPSSGAALHEWRTSSFYGYGVMLDIKKMEYKTIDDSSVNSNDTSDVLTRDDDHSNSEGSSDVDNEEREMREEALSGFVFSRLLSRFEEGGSESNTAARRQLMRLRDSLLHESFTGGAALKAWDLKNLGLQATQSIMDAIDPLRRLKQIAQNFPLFAKDLTRTRVRKELREELAANRRLFPEYMERPELTPGAKGGGNLAKLGGSDGAIVVVNGRKLQLGDGVSGATLNVFSLMNDIRTELAYARRTRALLSRMSPAAGRRALAGSSARAMADAFGFGQELQGVDAGMSRLCVLSCLFRIPSLPRTCH